MIDWTKLDSYIRKISVVGSPRGKLMDKYMPDNIKNAKRKSENG